jgi:hypothetical protein
VEVTWEAFERQTKITVRRWISRIGGMLILGSFAASTASAQVPSDPAWQEVATILQTQPVDGGGYVRFNLPRADLLVRIGDVTVAPALALTGWAGFSGSPDSAMAMGDLVVTEPELRPVLAELAVQKIDVTAIHNHLVGESPRIMYIHVHAAGAATDIARRLDAAIRRTGTPRPVARPVPAPLVIDSAAVFQAMGKRGRASGSFAQVSFLLVPGPVTMHGQTVVPSLGYASPVNIVQVSPTRAVSTGDFAVSARQVQPLLRALAAGGITATAVHSHLIGEQPAVYFIHFWGDAPLPELLRGLRAAVDAAQR